MRDEVDRLLAARGGVAARAELLGVLTRNQLDDEIARRHLVAPFPRAYCRPWDAEHEPTRERAALVSVGAPAALSHLTALRRWELTTALGPDIHVTVTAARHPIGRDPGLRVHRTRVPTRIHRVDGLDTVAAEHAVVGSWPLLRGPDQRAPAIEAARRRLVTPQGLRAVATRAHGLSGRHRLLRLIEHLEAGCESELEIWGYLGVFDVPGLDHAVRQRPLRIGGTTYRLDLGYDEEQVAIELDGHRFHSSRGQRERDMRRDAALSTINWLTLRYSHLRLHDDPDGCRRDALATLAARRAWRRSG